MRSNAWFSAAQPQPQPDAYAGLEKGHLVCIRARRDHSDYCIFKVYSKLGDCKVMKDLQAPRRLIKFTDGIARELHITPTQTVEKTACTSNRPLISALASVSAR
jgi:hypothetical protein